MAEPRHHFTSASETAYGWHVSGVLLHIAAASNGKRCDCTCLTCGHTLIAAQGIERAWHFKHKSRTDCRGISILLQAARIMMLNAAVTGEALSLPTPCDPELWREGDRSSRLESGIKLDATRSAAVASVATADGEIVVVIVNGTHARDTASVRVVDSRPTIEIDIGHLSSLESPEDLLQAVLVRAPRRWIVPPSWLEPVRSIGLDQQKTPDAPKRVTGESLPDNANEILRAVLGLLQAPTSKSASWISWPVGALAPKHAGDGHIRLHKAAFTTDSPKGTRYRTSGQVVDDHGSLLPADVLVTFKCAETLKKSKPGTLIVQCPRSIEGDWPSQLTVVWSPPRRKTGFYR